MRICIVSVQSEDRFIMKKNRVVGLVLAVLLCLVGCVNTQTAVTTDTICLSDQGTLTYEIVSDFSESYYDVTELTQMAQEEINAYGVGVSISKAAVENGVLRFAYTFDSALHYAAFMETSCYQNTVAAALANGYKSDTQLFSVKDAERMLTIGDASIRERNLFIWNEDVAVRCDGTVLYYSENLNVINKTDVEPKEGSAGPYYVVYK